MVPLLFVCLATSGALAANQLRAPGASRGRAAMLLDDESATRLSDAGLSLSDADLEAKYAPATTRFELLNSQAEEQRKNFLDDYARQKRGMIADQLFFTALGAAGLFAVGDRSMLAGFGLGATAGFFYLFLLQRTVDAVGDPEAGIRRGPPPITAVILLMAIFGKNHEQLSLFPALAGFGTYKLATIAQAFVPALSADRRIVGR